MRYSWKQNHSCRAPSNHVCFDTETVPVPSSSAPGITTNLLMCWTACSWRYEKGIVTREQSAEGTLAHTFWDWLYDLMSMRGPWHVWSHNAGFDLIAMGLPRELEEGRLLLAHPWVMVRKERNGQRVEEPLTGRLVTDDPPTIIDCWRPNGQKVTLVDSCNWVMESLESIGKDLDLPKLLTPSEIADVEDWFTYCRRDCDILAKLVQGIVSFVLDNDLGNLKLTAASQAVNWWRHKGNPELVCKDDDQERKKQEREGYYGGTREVYFCGTVVSPSIAGVERLAGAPVGMPVLSTGPVYLLDVSSAYPVTMRDNLFPLSHVRSLANPAPAVLLDALSALGGIASVRIHDEHNAWPVRCPDATVWKQGYVETTLVGPELLRALRSGVVASVRWAHLYSLGRPFTGWVEAALSLRRMCDERGQHLWARLCKLLANSLHGRMAMRGHKWETIPGRVAADEWGTFHGYDHELKRTLTMRSICHTTQRLMPEYEPLDASPIIAAYCTAYVREQMRQYREIAGPRNVFYTYIDSIHASREGYQRLHDAGCISHQMPGYLKLEKTANVVTYYAVNYYTWDGDRKIPGVAKNAHEDPKGLWRQENWLSLESMLSMRPPPGPVTSNREIPQPAPIVRGRISPSGWVDPLREIGYDEWMERRANFGHVPPNTMED